MPISGTTTDYIGRTLDINLSGNLNPLSTDAQNVTYAFSVNGGPVKYIAGVQKLAQRYLISLMNSGFVENLQGIASNNVQVAGQLFNSYNWTIVKAFRSFQSQNGTMPLDEQLNTLTLLNLTSSGDAAQFSLQLTTMQGTNVTFVLPLPL